MILLINRDLEIVLRYMQQDMKALVMGKLDVNQSGNEVQDHEMVSSERTCHERREGMGEREQTIMHTVSFFV